MEDAKEQTKERAFDHQKLCDKLNEATGGALEPYGLHLEHLMFNGDRGKMIFQLDDTKWSYDLTSQSLKKLKELESPRDRSHLKAYWGVSRDYLVRPPEVSPDSNWVTYIEDYNLWIRNTTSGRTYQLSYDGSEGDYYIFLYQMDSGF